jgi:hypothetical protein
MAQLKAQILGKKQPVSDTFGLKASLGKAERPRAKQTRPGLDNLGFLGEGQAPAPKGNSFSVDAGKTYERIADDVLKNGSREEETRWGNSKQNLGVK